MTYYGFRSYHSNVHKSAVLAVVSVISHCKNAIFGNCRREIHISHMHFINFGFDIVLIKLFAVYVNVAGIGFFIIFQIYRLPRCCYNSLYIRRIFMSSRSERYNIACFRFVSEPPHNEFIAVVERRHHRLSADIHERKHVCTQKHRKYNSHNDCLNPFKNFM